MKTDTTTKTIQTEITVNEGTGLAERLAITVRGFDTVYMTTDHLTQGVATYAMFHGLKQKLVDAMALSRNPDTGRSATNEDKFNAMMTVRQQLVEGHWFKPATGERKSGEAGLLFRALCIAYPNRAPSEIKSFIDGKSKSDQAALRKNAKIAKIIDTLREEDADDEIDTDEMLDQLADASDEVGE